MRGPLLSKRANGFMAGWGKNNKEKEKRRVDKNDGKKGGKWRKKEDKKEP